MDAEAQRGISAALTVKDLSFSYSRGSSQFTDFHLALGPGRTALLGSNGAGKSTLLSLLATVLKPSNGSISLSFGPRAVESRRLGKYRARIAWLPQDFQPAAGLSVQEHVAYSAWLNGTDRKTSQKKAMPALERVGLEQLAKHKATELSGGQQRRLGLAGALAQDAAMILLDEPTAGLDPNQRDRFRMILQEIDPEKIVLVSTHQTEDIDGTFDQVLVMDQGTMKFHGTVGDFMQLGSRAADPRDQIREAYRCLVAGEH